MGVGLLCSAATSSHDGSKAYVPSVFGSTVEVTSLPAACEAVFHHLVGSSPAPWLSSALLTTNMHSSDRRRWKWLHHTPWKTPCPKTCPEQRHGHPSRRKKKKREGKVACRFFYLRIEGRRSSSPGGGNVGLKRHRQSPPLSSSPFLDAEVGIAPPNGICKLSTCSSSHRHALRTCPGETARHLNPRSASKLHLEQADSREGGSAAVSN